MIKLRGIAIDDEPLALEVIKNHAASIPELEILGTFTNPLEAISFIKKEKIDLVFLDIEMPEISGLKLTEVLNNDVSVVFVTAYEHHALKSYDLNASDYLLKPVSFERFLRAVTKIIDQKYLDKSTLDWDNQSIGSENIFIKSDKKIIQVRIKEINYIEGLKDYVVIHLEKNKIVTRESLKKITSLLEEHNFVRVHRSFIVPIEKINTLEGNLINLDGVNIPIGKSFREYLLGKIDPKMIGKRPNG